MQNKQDNQKNKYSAHAISHYGAEQLLPPEDEDLGFLPLADDMWAPETFLNYTDEPVTEDEEYPPL